jgi:hypothetical protein
MSVDHQESSDRRDVSSRDALIEKFREELQHVPGLALTVEQTSRLFDIPRDVCGRLLSALVETGDIYVRPDGRFVGLSPTRE